VGVARQSSKEVLDERHNKKKFSETQERTEREEKKETLGKQGPRKTESPNHTPDGKQDA